MSFRGGDGCSLEVFFLFCFGCFDVFQSHDFYVSKRKPSFKKKIKKKKLSGLLLPRKVCIALRKLDGGGDDGAAGCGRIATHLNF